MIVSRFLNLRGSILASLISLLALAALTLNAAPAVALPTQFGGLGSGAGQAEEARGVAVEQSSGDVYIVDRNNSRVEKWSGEGAFLEGWGFGVENGEEKFETCTTATGCRGGIAGSAAGQFDFPEGVAVDNSLGLSHGDLYIVDKRNNRVEKFGPDGEFILMFGGEVNETKDAEAGASEAEKDLCTQAEIEASGVKCKAGVDGSANGEFAGKITGAAIVAVNSEGRVYVGDENSVQRFSEGGVYEATVLQGAGEIEGIAAAPGGDVYVLSSKRAGVREYGETGAEVGSPRDEAGVPETIAATSSGSLFVNNGPDPATHSMRAYAANGAETEVFDEGEEDSFRGIAFGETLGVLYALGRASVRVVTPPPPGPLVPVNSTSAGEVQPTSATLHATVNPEDHASEYAFEYGTAPCTNSSCGTSTAKGTLSAAFERDAVEMTVSKLQPETTYHFRVLATDSEGHRTVGPEASFTTPPAVVIEETSAIDVGSNSATLRATLDPLGAQARWRIEYGPTISYGSVAGESTIPAVATAVPVYASQSDLTAASTYHYRVVAEDEREGSTYVLDGPDRMFTTQAAKTSFELPDGRQWELVSPANMHGAFMEPIGLDLIQASANGDEFVGVADIPNEAQAASNANEVDVLSVRGADGWVSKDISSPHDNSPGDGANVFGAEYRFLSEDLSRAIVQPLGSGFTPLSPEATEQTAYLRSDFLAGDPASLCTESCYTPLVSAANVPTGTHFDETKLSEVENAPCYEYQCGPRFVAATPDAEHIVLRSSVQLTDEAPTEGNYELYEWNAGKLQLLSLLPQGETNRKGGQVASEVYVGGHESAFRGYYDDNAQRAISDNGTRVIFDADNADVGEAEEGFTHLYLRDTLTHETVRLDLPQGGTGTGGAVPRYMTASTDGSRIFFIDEAGLTKESSLGGSDLYEYNLEAPSGRRLKDLSVDANGAAAVANVLGASEDGSYIYFTAAGALAQGASPGECGETGASSSKLCNLYVWHEGVTTFIAGLSQDDYPDWRRGGEGVTELSHMTGRVSPNGRYLSFMSDRPLTGYDSTDAVSGQPDQEVFLYSAAATASEAGKLVCASCNATGAEPIGEQYEGEGVELELVGAHDIFKHDQGLAALLPPWTSFEGTESAIYQSRYLSNAGRLFFDSYDPLVPQDVGGNWGVYEYESPGMGSCTKSSSTYSERAEGCQSLISSPTAREESAFLDASESGADVFFLTSEKLVEGDLNSGTHVYDAHECTASAPCFPTPVASSPPCEASEACMMAPNAEPTVLGEPPSATFSGAGNLTSTPVKPAKKLTRRQTLAKALKICAKKRKRKRGMCEARARRRYGAPHKTDKHGKAHRSERTAR